MCQVGSSVVIELWLGSYRIVGLLTIFIKENHLFVQQMSLQLSCSQLAMCILYKLGTVLHIVAILITALQIMLQFFMFLYWYSTVYSYVANLLYKVSVSTIEAARLSVCLTVVLISQLYQHGLKQDLLKMKAESSGTMKYIFKNLDVRRRVTPPNWTVWSSYETKKC